MRALKLVQDASTRQKLNLKVTNIVLLQLVTLFLVSLISNYNIGCDAAGNLALMLTGEPDDDEFSLSLGSSPPKPSVDRVDDNTLIMKNIMNDDYSGEFGQTESIIGTLSSALEQFAKEEHLSSATSQPISEWLISRRGIAPSDQTNFYNQKLTTELDYIYTTYWSQLKPLIELIVTVRPENLGWSDLAFRCDKRIDELQALKSMAANSPVYNIILDVFFTELYVHCFKRKLALIELNHVRPSPILRQFVDIYLDNPERTRSGYGSSAKVQADIGLKFDLQASVRTHGSLEEVANFVLDTSDLSLTSADKNIAGTVMRFHQDCSKHLSELNQLWGYFDSTVASLSSSTNDLVSLNNQAKLMAPHLVYGTVCAQLMRV